MAYLTPWERIQFLMNHYEFTTVSEFAAMLSAKKSAGLYQIKKGNNGISIKLAKTITSKYPEISTSWLIMGEGEPLLVDDSSDGFHLIPYYTNFTMHNIKNYPPDDSLPISENFSHGAEYATILKNDCLEPKIPAGSIILLKNCTQIIFGNRYYIELQTGNSLYRIIRKSEMEGFVRLVSENPAYDEIEISETEITALYIFLGFTTFFN